jgi:hypothetical protein
MYIKQRGELFVLISSIVIRAPLIFSGLGINEPQHKKIKKENTLMSNLQIQ